MIRGFFDESGRPRLDGLVRIPRMGVTYAVDFLVDTGADITVLHYPDVSFAGVDFDFLVRESEKDTCEGVGGIAEYFVEKAIVDLLDDSKGETLSYPIDLYIATPSQSEWHQASLLGRNIIDLHDMIYSPRTLRLEFAF